MAQLQRWLLQAQRLARSVVARTNAMVILIVVPLLVAVVPLFFITPKAAPTSSMSLSELAREVRSGQIAAITIDGGSITVTDTDGAVDTIEYSGNVIDVLTHLGVTTEELAAVDLRGRTASPEPSWIDGISAAMTRGLVVFVALILMLYLQAMTAMARPAAAVTSARQGRKVTFDDVAGLAEAKEDLLEVVGFLRDPAPFRAFGAKVPKGVLLVGPPGNGKTLLARAVAGEAGVEFLAASGSDFVEVFVGRGAARVRALFQQARRQAPCVVFIDELDSLGRHRGSAHAENDHALNQLLVAMDGFSSDDRVVVLAATNRVDMLDTALLRPGRFDRRVTVPPPDVQAREAILRLHAREKPVGDDVDLAQLARTTTGLSGADLANVMNEAAILAVRRGQPAITTAELSEAVDRTLVGPSRKGELISERERRIVAYHEAGHALTAHLVGEGETVHKVSIVSRGLAGGFTRLAHDEDTRLWSRKRCESTLVWLLGGRAAEAIVFDDVTTGAQDDLRRATALSRAMVTHFGMSERLGPLTLEAAAGLAGPIGGPAHTVGIGPQLATVIDEEVQALVRGADLRARDLLMLYRERLDALTEALLAEETLEGKRLQQLLGEPATV